MHAILSNGIALHVGDYQDTLLGTTIHPIGPVASALLVFGETLDRPIPGKQSITALCADIEAECKVGLVMWPRPS